MRVATEFLKSRSNGPVLFTVEMEGGEIRTSNVFDVNETLTADTNFATMARRFVLWDPASLGSSATIRPSVDQDESQRFLS